MKEYNSGQSESLEHSEELREHYDIFSRPAVGQNAGNRSAEEYRGVVAERDNAEIERRAGESVHKPACGDHLHPGSNEGNALTCEEKPVISMF